MSPSWASLACDDAHWRPPLTGSHVDDEIHAFSRKKSSDAPRTQIAGLTQFSAAFGDRHCSFLVGDA
jgi:hypothetical protein